MLIKEYHILLPMSLDEYQVAQLYMIQVRTAGGLYWNRASWWSEARIRRPQGDSSAGFPPPPNTHTSSVSGFCRPEEENRHPLDILKRKGGTEGQKGRKGQRVLSIH